MKDPAAEGTTQQYDDVVLVDSADIADAHRALGAPPEGDGEEDTQARRMADAMLVSQAERYGFTGHQWAQLGNFLAQYALPVLMSWMGTRKICHLCAERGRPIRQPPDFWSSADQWDLASLTVARALNHFRDRVLLPGRWDAERSSLRTFFMSVVISQFPNTYNSWYDVQLKACEVPGSHVLEEIVTGAPPSRGRHAADPAVEVTTRLHLVRVLEQMPEDLQHACALLWAGYSMSEAAAQIGKSSAALSEQLRRFRTRRGRELA